MITIIEKLIRKNISPQKRRQSLGAALSVVGVCLNLALFISKLCAGRRSGSIAITTDAYNNLFDASGWILTLLGFLLASLKSSRQFPFGCGRIEYLSGTIVSLSILTIGAKLFISSVEKSFHPEPIENRTAAVAVMLFSLLIKGYMFAYTRRIGRTLNAAPFKAASVDSLCDCISTLGILLSIGISQMFGVNIDGICGTAVAVCILWAGAVSMKESLSPLIGRRKDEYPYDLIHELLWDHSGVRALNVALHDYGPAATVADVVVDKAPDDIGALKALLKEKANIEAFIEIRSSSPFGNRQNNPPEYGQE